MRNRPIFRANTNKLISGIATHNLFNHSILGPGAELMKKLKRVVTNLMQSIDLPTPSIHCDRYSPPFLIVDFLQLPLKRADDFVCPFP